MKYLVFFLVLIFASPAFADRSYSAFDGANGLMEESDAVQDNQAVGPESEFKIDERLYAESIGSNTGYYGGGYYGEETYASLTDYYLISSYHHGDFGFRSGFIVINDQLVPSHFVFPFIASFPVFRSGVFPGGIGVNIGSFTFFSRGLGFGHR